MESYNAFMKTLTININEITIFKYLNTSDIFQSFFNLNLRFNTLLSSLNNLHHTIPEDNQCENIDLFCRYIYSLTILGKVVVNLNRFKHIHCLILHDPVDTLLQQLDIDNLPYLEYLSIPDVLFRMSSMYQKLFSNRFPNLKFCNLFECETIETILPWTQTLSLCFLKIGFIDFYVYTAILSACPNLYYLKLHIFQSYLKLSDIQPHRNLRKLEIYSEIIDWYYNDQLIDNFLRCLPNLEELIIYRLISKIVDPIPDYDWLASIISIRLSLLRYFIFSLHLEYDLAFIDFITTEMRRQLRKLFLNAHKNRYQSRFIIN
ncbi:unnamed protein product [Rotaria magnacalcarata]|uniref:Uncharacterized protein n=1 Tax=Rotaria magnacalcarata TaxID=392030 RepID=A0A815UPW8_9BILA|nr:unnamed protein product [Rotaria magnacalcarata]CAF1613390.1 unnamed protein product [Rotaria magnacalcarata]CAF2053739.1 unnamed protein product [Rotaria magnacalcarata]CAF4760407.1 unnamed protein product [Rotaria magnacalcarata]CAF5038387.1 unnamed protein product [Rotaria magnacalcarata]